MKLNNIIKIFNNKKLTNNEKLVLLYFLSNIEDNLDTPIYETNDEIALHCSITDRTASSVIKSLIEKNIIKVHYNGHFRKIEIFSLK